MTLIAFDGPIATGKSTLIDSLKKDYEKQLKEPIVIGDRDNTEENIRASIKITHRNDLKRGEFLPITLSYLRIIQQTCRLESEIIPNLDRLILADRYLYTPIVSRYLTLRKYGAKLEDVVDGISRPFGIQLTIPDKSIILVAPIEVIEERFKLREGYGLEDFERDVIAETIGLYKELERYFDNYFVVDSSPSKEDVLDKVRGIL